MAVLTCGVRATGAFCESTLRSFSQAQKISPPTSTFEWRLPQWLADHAAHAARRLPGPRERATRRSLMWDPKELQELLYEAAYSRCRRCAR